MPGLSQVSPSVAAAVATHAAITSGVHGISTYGATLTAAADAAAARTVLGLGTIATQAANNVAITGGTISASTIAATTSVSAPAGGLLYGGADILARANTWTSGQSVVVNANSTATALSVQNVSTGTAALALQRVQNDVGVNARFLVGGSGATGAFLGGTRANACEVSAAGAGLTFMAVGTFADAPIYFVTNSAERMRLTNAGLAIGATSLVGSERLRVSDGSTPGTPLPGDVLIGNGVSKSGRSMQTLGSLGAGGVQVDASSGTVANLSISDVTTVNFSTTTATTVQGISGGFEGRVLFLVFSNAVFTLSHLSASTETPNRIACPGNVDFVASVARSGVFLVYSGSVWRVVAHTN